MSSTMRNILVSIAVTVVVVLFSCKESQLETTATTTTIGASTGASSDDSSNQNKLELQKYINECSYLTADERAYISSLRQKASDSTNLLSSLYHKDATFNQIAELGRIGCKSELEFIYRLAQENQAIIYGSGGTPILTELNINKMSAIIGALSSLADKKDTEVIAFLSIHANNSASYFQNSAAISLKAISDKPKYTPFGGSYREDWNNPSYTASTSYLLIDGSRVGYISDWIAYENSISSLNPTAAILDLLIQEPRYADGLNGYRIQSQAVSRIAFSSLSVEMQYFVNHLKLHQARGNQLNKKITERIMSDQGKNYNSFSLNELKLLLTLIDENSQNFHADEMIRADVIQVAITYCGNFKSHYSECKNEVAPILKERLQKDLYYIVRSKAYEALTGIWNN